MGEASTLSPTLTDKEFEVMVIKMFTDLRKKMKEHREYFKKETENIKKYQINYE